MSSLRQIARNITQTSSARKDRAELASRPCPWTKRQVMRHPTRPNSYRYVDTGKPCPVRVALAAGFRPKPNKDGNTP